MNKEKENLNQSTEELNIIFKALGNMNRFNVLIYLNSVKFASSKSIIRKLNLKNSLVSKSMNILLRANLITKVKLFSSTIYTVNQNYKKYWFFQSNENIDWKILVMFDFNAKNKTVIPKIGLKYLILGSKENEGMIAYRLKFRKCWINAPSSVKKLSN